MDLPALYRAGFAAARPVHAYYRARLYRRARDVTRAIEGGALLVVAPHPDDEVLGCGALIARKRAAGERVRIVYASDGGRSHPVSEVSRERLIRLRRAEAIEGAAVLGVAPSDLRFLGVPDGDISGAMTALVGALVKEIRDIAPAQLLVTSALDFHPDHQGCARATRQAAIETGYRGLAYEYPVWYWRHLPWTHQPSSVRAAAWHFACDPVVEWWRVVRERPHAVRAGSHLEAKKRALAAHRSQVAGIEGGEAPLQASFVEEFLGESEIFFRMRLER